MTSSTNSTVRKFPRLSTLEIVIMVVTGAVFGLLGAGINTLWVPLTSLLGMWVSNVLTGPFFSCGLVSARIIRKPGVAFITHNLFSLALVLLGDPFGLTNFIFGIAQGVAFEIVLGAFRYRRWDRWTILLAALLATVFDIPVLYFVMGFAEQPFWTWFGPLLARPLYVLPVVYVLAVSIPNLLERTGLVKQGQTG